MRSSDKPGLGALDWLSDWYAGQCNGAWEHAHGISLSSLDNPGWLLEVDLAGTELADEPESVVMERGDPPSSKNGNLGAEIWMRCEVKEKKFVGAGDAHRLVDILAEFRRWLHARRDP